MAAVEENRRLALTEARLTRLHGGYGRGDHGEAQGERSNAFLRWRGERGECGAMADGDALLQRTVEGEECEMGKGECVRAGAR